MELRTSITSPLQIGTIPVSKGKIGLTLCPGKKQATSLTGGWNRDLETDLEAIKEWGKYNTSITIITLLEPIEFHKLSVVNLPDSIRNEGLSHIHLPIPDKGVMSKDVLNEKWPDISELIRILLAQGSAILIHCNGGFGRTGTIAAMILVDHGMTSAEAIDACRAVRENAVENWLQREFVMKYAGEPTVQPLMRYEPTPFPPQHYLKVEDIFKTYSFRAECQHDVFQFMLALHALNENASLREVSCISIFSPYENTPDVAVEMKSTVSRERQIKIAYDLNMDLHVIAQTLRECPLSENCLERDFSIRR